MKIIFFANTDWYLYNFRLSLAHYLRHQGHEVYMLSPPGPYVEKIEAEGFHTFTIPLNRQSLNPIEAIQLIKKICFIYRQERPDLVHHFTLKCIILGGLAARIVNVPACVNAVTGLGYIFASTDRLAHLLRLPIRLLLLLIFNHPKSRLILQNINDQEELTAKRFIRSEWIHLIRSSGVNTQHFQPRQQTRQIGPFRILLAARLIWDKGVGEYIEAARQLQQNNLNAEFLLAGTPDLGNPASIPLDTIKDWQKQGLITWLGHIDNMKELLLDVDLAVLPSYYREGIPRSLMEAAACGLPIITTDAIGCREVVDPNINGLLIPIKDPIALADAIRQLCENPEICQRMGIASRTKALLEFKEEIVFEKTLGVYHEITT